LAISETTLGKPIASLIAPISLYAAMRLRSDFDVAFLFCALLSSLARPEYPSRAEMTVSSWDPWRRGSATAPTRDGSSPFSSLANVLHSDRVSTIRSPSTSPKFVSNIHKHLRIWGHTTITTDHISRGEFFDNI